MESNTQQSGGSPAKPWEHVSTLSSSTPFKPPSSGSTSDVVEASGTAKPGEIVSGVNRNVAVNRNPIARPLPTRPWEQQTYGNTYAGYGSGYNGGYGAGMYGSSYGGLGGSYNGGIYGNTYRGSYNVPYGGSIYGGGMYNSNFGGPMGGYGLSTGPLGNQDPNDPYGPPPSPPGFWISFLRVMQGVVNFFGRISILIDQNTQAFHLFMTALLQLFDRTGLLYGELARFVLRLLGFKAKPRKHHGPEPHQNQLPLPHNSHNHSYIEGEPIKTAPDGGAWDSVWGERGNNY